jgi:hypothetical protein
MTNSSGIKPEAVEQLGNTLRRDYRNLKRAVLDEDPDARTRSFVSKLGRTVEDTIKMLTDLSKEKK